MATIKLTASEQDLLGQMARFAERRAVNGVYLNLGYSKSLATPVLILMALGDQALALEKIVMDAAVPDNVIQMPVAQDFIKGNGDS